MDQQESSSAPEPAAVLHPWCGCHMASSGTVGSLYSLVMTSLPATWVVVVVVFSVLVEVTASLLSIMQW